jgi:competence protein ComEA
MASKRSARSDLNQVEPEQPSESGAEVGLEPAVVERLTGLLLLDMAAVEAYGVATRACKAPDISRRLQEFRQDHERHVRDLSKVLRDAGAEPPEEPDERGQCIRSYTDLSAREDRTALIAMRGNEELTNDAYTSALASDLPEELRGIIEANWQDERRHIRWITEEVRTRGWELPEAPPELEEAA